ncbi:hypothetical protein J5N97_017842 [Dioscorea zingiberensis]|uniref:4-aminobutyrate--pyruvate transaminase n=1 Tax=Dioscorea zingiberensis TaxID=325984 RepID=A0A9D5CMU2_9LILI|nr:hypothetical protein J5N97_017842 [Dioscorea zingiberensis]
MAYRLLRSKITANPFSFEAAGLLSRHVTVSGNSQACSPQCCTAFYRQASSEVSLQTEQGGEKGYKGHDMLAPFTAGWQSTDLHPLVIERSEGSYVCDCIGKKYLYAFAGLWCTALGGNEPRLVEAATKQLNKLPFYHSFWNRTTRPSLDLAKEILEIFTARKMGKVFFTNSGSEANDSQVKLVWYYFNALGRPNKKKFIARTKSYHGSTLISASLSGLQNLHQKFDLPAPFVLHTDCPHYWRFHLPGETEEEFSTRLANNLENLILKEGPDTIAAFIAEPVMGAGGVILPPKTYFEKVQAVIKKYDILFIADEIRGTGLVLGTEFTDNKSPNQPFPSEWGVGLIFGAECEKRGMLVRVAGDSMMMAPPFIISPEEVDELISIYGESLRSTERIIEELKSQNK